MRKLVLIATLSALGLLFQADFASARGHGCGGGRHGGCGSSCGSCGSSYCGSCGYSSCGSCGYSSCGSCGYGSCGSCGSGGYCSSCAGGLCTSTYTADPSTAVVQQADPQAATLIVTLPEDAKVLIDDHVTTSTSAERVYTTPALEDGKDFHYTLKIQVVRDGHMQTVTRDVTVRSGETTRINVEVPTTAAAE